MTTRCKGIKKAPTTIVPVTEKQIAALKYLIMVSFDASNFCKRLCYYLIDHSERLTRPVFISIAHSDGGSPEGISFANQVGQGIHDMNSSCGSTHLGTVMEAIGTELQFSSYSGIEDPAGRYYSGGYRACLAPIFYNKSAIRLACELQQIQEIRLNGHGLHDLDKDKPEPEERGRSYLATIRKLKAEAAAKR